MIESETPNDVGMIARWCQECRQGVLGHCEGKLESETQAGKKPCKKYELYFDEETENQEEQEEQEEQAESKPDAGTALWTGQYEPDLGEDLENPVIDKPKRTTGGSKPLEQRHNDFQRILARRLPKAVSAIESIGKLNNSYAYEWSDKEIETVEKTLYETVEEMIARFA